MTKDEALKMAICWLDNQQLDYSGHSVRKACQEALEHPAQEHSMTYEDGFAHGYDAHLADYALTPIKVTHEILRQDSKWEGEPIKTDWDESRIDTIGQNGNEGLHY